MMGKVSAALGTGGVVVGVLKEEGRYEIDEVGYTIRAGGEG